MGILFTRDPVTGARGVVGDFWPLAGGKWSLGDLMKKDDQKAAELGRLAALVEAHFKDMQDVEFIVEESGNVLVIQTRRGRRTATASLKVLATPLSFRRVPPFHPAPDGLSVL